MYRHLKLSSDGRLARVTLERSDRRNAFSAELMREMIAAGVEAHLATVDLAKLPASFAGRRFDRALLSALPAGIDPCGENGEFHSFVNAGPMFAQPIRITVGETVQREGFAYADLLPA